ncbi:GNAT family N-acetyltransferase [Ovoidimarina sediminis]|uniref:GNAT family N-acetyltransferase n=1 Tax=Ovoidimarina sediminis TaxID=3079856 RepID=UPI0029142F10|nr:GNAT family N-acetyltransferase [Rhodophyticola sp. MJ-SS7]MDU8942934.1 GNAT family N-acetyltransferase [Rhodophyticola sp. MJ-SS7]
MSEFEILREVDGSKGRYVIRRGGEEAELTYSILSPQKVIADHTGVPDAFKGTGMGRALVRRLVEDARAEGFEIVPLCPYVNAERRRNPDWADAFDV